MGVLNQRDPDEIQQIARTRDDLDELTRTLTARWGRVPIVGADPTAPPDGSLWLRSDLGELRFRANGITGFVGASGAGAPSGLGSNGQEYWDTTNKRLYRSDGAGWVIMAEPTVTTFVPVITSGTGTITTVGAVTFSYRRHDGWLDWFESITITTNGTGASFIRTTLPVAMNVGQNIGGGREVGLTGSAVSVTGTASQADILTYNNAYPGGTGAVIQVRGQYQMTTRYS